MTEHSYATTRHINVPISLSVICLFFFFFFQAIFLLLLTNCRIPLICFAHWNEVVFRIITAISSLSNVKKKKNTIIERFFVVYTQKWVLLKNSIARFRHLYLLSFSKKKNTMDICLYRIISLKQHWKVYNFIENWNRAAVCLESTEQALDKLTLRILMEGTASVFSVFVWDINSYS